MQETAYSIGDMGSILGREGPLEKEMATHSSCLGNPTDKGVWWAVVHGSKNRTTEQLYHHHYQGVRLKYLENVFSVNRGPYL